MFFWFFFVKFCCFSFVSHSHFALFSYNLTSCYFFFFSFIYVWISSVRYLKVHTYYIQILNSNVFWDSGYSVWLFVFTCVISLDVVFFLLKDEKNGIHQQKKWQTNISRQSKFKNCAFCYFVCAKCAWNCPSIRQCALFFCFWLTEQQMTGRIGNYLDTHHWDNFSINKITNSYDQFWWMYCANYAQHQFKYIFSSQFVGSFIFIHLFLHIEKLLLVTFKTACFVVCWDIEQRPIRLTLHSLYTIYY